MKKQYPTTSHHSSTPRVKIGSKMKASRESCTKARIVLTTIGLSMSNLKRFEVKAMSTSGAAEIRISTVETFTRGSELGIFQQTFNMNSISKQDIVLECK